MGAANHVTLVPAAGLVWLAHNADAVEILALWTMARCQFVIKPKLWTGDDNVVWDVYPFDWQ